MSLYISVSADQRPLFPGWLFVRWHPASVCNITVCTHFYHLYVIPACGLISLWGTQSVPKSTDGTVTVPASWVVGSICRFVFLSSDISPASLRNSPLCFCWNARQDLWGSLLDHFHFYERENKNRKADLPGGLNHFQLPWCSRRHVLFSYSHSVLCSGTLHCCLSL